MINVFIFLAHFIFIIVVFVKTKKSDSLGGAINNTALIVIIFAVLWAISNFIVNMLMDTEGLGKFFDRDTISLSIVTMVEIVFYLKFYGKKIIEDETEKQ